MRPKDIKLTYFFDESNNKIKIQPEYLEYSEVDDSYSEILANSDIPSDDPLQNDARQSQQEDIFEWET